MTTAPFFPDFKPLRLVTSGAIINGVVGGQGPPLLLLQGWPQSHIEWQYVAPVLASKYTVIATDLRGYGDSSKPASTPTHEPYAKRTMARDQIEVMRALGFDKFAVVGHDRGGRVAHRMALDHPAAITQLAILDIVPTLTVYNTVKHELASAYFHWFLLTQPAPVPETLLGNNGDFFLRNVPFRGLVPLKISEAAFAEYLRCFSDPATLHAMCEDYRAAGTIDLEHDRADIDQRIQCPLLALWGARGAMAQLYDVLATWQARGSDVRGHALPAGHWIPEESPRELCDALLNFLT